MESKQENNKQRKQRQVIYFCCTKLSLREGFTSGSNPRPTQYCFFSFYIRALKYFDKQFKVIHLVETSVTLMKWWIKRHAHGWKRVSTFLVFILPCGSI